MNDMIYKLDMNIKPNPILPWANIFSYLSIWQFRQVYDLLDFPFIPPDDLRQVAHDFSLTYMILLRGGEYSSALEALLRNSETVSSDLLEGTLPDDPYAKKRDTLFTNTFTYLEQLGYGETVYQWGKQTDNYIQYADRQRHDNLMALDNLSHLLREWAVLEWMKEPSVFAYELYSSDWDDVFASFVPIYTETNLTLESLPLSLTSRAALQAIILHHEARKTRLRTTTDEIMATPKSVWEEISLLDHGAINSIRLEGDKCVNLHEWNTIVNTLSADELGILEQWALPYEHLPGRKLKIPLPDFRAILDENSNWKP